MTAVFAALALYFAAVTVAVLILEARTARKMWYWHDKAFIEIRRGIDLGKAFDIMEKDCDALRAELRKYKRRDAKGRFSG